VHVASITIALYIIVAVAKAKIFPHLKAWVRVGCGIPRRNGHDMFVSAESFQGINVFKKSIMSNLMQHSYF
jgi:hypothetical protein